MLSHHVSLALGFSLIPLSLVHAYTWPDPKTDEIEALFRQQTGYHSSAFIEFVQPCNLVFDGEPNSGRQTAAEWLRTAFHDMSMHDVTSGIGGLDASIALELDQSENAGFGLINTVSFFVSSMSA